MMADKITRLEDYLELKINLNYQEIQSLSTEGATKTL